METIAQAFRDEGRAEGLQLGVEIGRLEARHIAFNMLAAGANVEDIIESITSLDVRALKLQADTESQSL